MTAAATAVPLLSRASVWRVPNIELLLRLSIACAIA
jgi:hypothetical protein